jgi:hypothetical protein
LLQNCAFVVRETVCSHKLSDHGQRRFDGIAAINPEPPPLTLSEPTDPTGVPMFPPRFGALETLPLGVLRRTTSGGGIRHVVHSDSLSV